MTYWQRFWRIELLSILALLIYAIGLTAVILGDELLRRSEILEALEFAFIGIVVTMWFGVLPVIAYGAPIYAAFIVSEKFRWYWMLLISVVPGVALIFLEWEIGLMGIAGCVSVFGMVHFAYRRWIDNTGQMAK